MKALPWIILALVGVAALYFYNKAKTTATTIVAVPVQPTPVSQLESWLTVPGAVASAFSQIGAVFGASTDGGSSEDTGISTDYTSI